MIDPTSIGLKLAPLAAEQLAKLRRRDEVQNLLRASAADAGRTSGVPPGDVKRVHEKVMSVAVDPHVMGGIKRLLDEGDLTVMPALEGRLRELIEFDDPTLDGLDLPGATARAFERKLHAAKRDDRAAAHVDALVTRSFTAERLDRLRADLTEAVEATGGTIVNELLALAHQRPEALGLPQSIERAVERLAERNHPAAAQVRAALRAGGPERAAELVRKPQAWTEEGGSALWAALGEICDAAGRFAEAEQAYLTAAERPDVDDRARQLVRAAVAAEHGGDAEHASELLDRAEGLHADNPAVLLARARREPDPTKVLALLDRVSPVDPPQAVLRELTAASAHLARGDEQAARQGVARARDLDPDDEMADELDAVIELIVAQRALPEEKPLDPAALRRAGERFERLSEGLQRGRPGAAAALLARGAQALALAGDERRAGALLDRALALGADRDARETLAEAAMLLRRFDDVLAVVPDDGEEEHRLLRANARVLGGGAADVADAAGMLEELLPSDDDAVRSRAAFTRLAAASHSREVPWHEGAERIVAAENPAAAAIVKAERLADEGDLDAAERTLAPHTSHPGALRALTALAVRRERWGEARRLSEELIARAGEPRDRLNHTALLARGGERDAARDQLLGLARADDVPDDARRDAYARAARLAMDLGDHVEVARVASEWARHAPDDDDARWLHIFALVRRIEHAQALQIWREGELQVTTLQQALLLAEVFAFGADLWEAVAKLAELSDQFGRPEELEYNLITTALRLEKTQRDDIPSELDERIRAAFAEFPERFPQSRLLRAFKLDHDDVAGSFMRMVREQLGRRASVLRDIDAGIRNGSAATCARAATLGRSTGEEWLGFRALPMGYSEAQRTQRERADAADALEHRGAVWDPTAVFVVGGLAPAVRDLLRNALPASLLAESAYADAVRDVARPEGEERGEIGYDPDADQLLVGARSRSELEREEARAAGTLEFAKGFTTRADRDPERPDVYDELLADSDMPAATRAWPATLVLARRTGLPVFSDDRYVRLSAHQMGLRSFGTLTLIDVLAERGMLTGEQRRATRRRLYATGCWGLDLMREELIEFVREDDFEPTQGAWAALHDLGAWRSRGISIVDDFLALLDVVADERPDVFDRWVHRLVDAMTQTLRGDYEQWSRFLVFVAINPLPEEGRISTAGLQSLIVALRSLPWFRYFRPGDDLVIGALKEALGALNDGPERAFYFKRAIERLTEQDREGAVATFVR